MSNRICFRLMVGLMAFGVWAPVVTAAITYQLEFAGTWSADTHPGAYPGGSAHFTDLVGGTHDETVSFWETGGLATPGIERVAELGSNSIFLNEVQAAIDTGTAASKISGPSLFGLPNSGSIMFDVSASHPLITLASMIAPSPDWFVGVSALSLRDDDQWLGRVEVDLLAYDAGTEEGEGFSLSNPATSPQEAIKKITSGVFVGLPPLAKLTFTIQPNGLPGDFDLNGTVGDADLLAWESGFGGFMDGSATVLDGDANEDGYVDGADYLLWQKNYGTSLAEATASLVVPEARSAVLLFAGWAILLATRLRRYAPTVVASLSPR